MCEQAKLNVFFVSEHEKVKKNKLLFGKSSLIGRMLIKWSIAGVMF